MKRRIALLSLVLLAIFVLAVTAPRPAASQQAANLLRNGDFESGASEWEGIAAGQLVAGDAPSGKTSVKITGGEGTQGSIPVTPGASYVLTAWFKWTVFEGSDWGYDRVAVFDPDFAEVAVLSRLHERYEPGKWHRIALAFTPQTPTVRVTFGMFGPQNQVELYFDGFEVYERAENLPPEISIDGGSREGAAPFNARFSAAASDPDGAIAHYQWDFGDGSISTSDSPEHTFQSRGAYPVTLTVWDNDGASAQKTTVVRVSDAQSPSVEVVSPGLVERIAAYPEQSRLQGAVRAADGSEIVSVVWDNISTGEAGIAEIDAEGAPGSSTLWTSGQVDLKAGMNEILITATDDQGRVGTRKLYVPRRIEQPAVTGLSPLPPSVPV